MKWRRVVQNTLIALPTLVQVAACRILYGRRAFAPDDVGADAAPILVIRCEAKIGDNLLHIPFLRALRARYPTREIHLLHNAAARSIYERCPYVDKRIEITWAMSTPVTLLRRLSLSAAVFRGSLTRYGLALVPRWDEDLYAPFLAWMSGSPRIVGFSRRVHPEKAWRNIGTDLLLTDAVLDKEVRHESQRSFRLLECVAHVPSALSAELEFWFSEEDREKVTSLMDLAAPSGAVWIAMAPGAAVNRRKWPITDYASVARALGQLPGVHLLLVGSSADATDCESMLQAGRPGRSLNLAGELSLAQTAASLQACRFFIGNDSGLMHLACAVRTPVIEISCHPMHASECHANSPARFGPSVEGSVVLRPTRPLTPACREGCESDTAHCITTVDVRSVEEAIASLMNSDIVDPLAKGALPPNKLSMKG